MQVETGESRCSDIADRLLDYGVWRIPGAAENTTRVWRVSPTPFPLDAALVRTLTRLGPALLSFYNAANSLYLRHIHPWANEYLDMGKPETLVEHARMNYQKRRLPAIIRPDIILTEDGSRITELDSVPGGMGQLDAMSKVYAEFGCEILGGTRGMLHGFDSMICAAAETDDPALAIVVSDESNDYRPEMSWLADALREIGRRAWMIRPEDLQFTEDGLYIESEGKSVRIDVVYRFFELFDLKNIPKAELLMYAAKKKRVVVTPPFKHFLEEKMLLAILHNPLLDSYWQDALGKEDYDLLKELIPETWILDSRPVPPHATIAGLRYRGQAVRDWSALKESTQKERRMVIKPSGFSPLAWGSRGVVIGHDMSAEGWSDAVEDAVASFRTLPYVLQHFNEGKRVVVDYFDQSSNEMKGMQGRVRLNPYYFVTKEGASLAGALATVVPLNKKLIHGMVDAVMAPCKVSENA